MVVVCRKGKLRQDHTEDLVMLLYTGHTQNRSGCINIATMLAWVFCSWGKGWGGGAEDPHTNRTEVLVSSHLLEVKSGFSTSWCVQPQKVDSRSFCCAFYVQSRPWCFIKCSIT